MFFKGHLKSSDTRTLGSKSSNAREIEQSDLRIVVSHSELWLLLVLLWCSVLSNIQGTAFPENIRAFRSRRIFADVIDASIS